MNNVILHCVFCSFHKDVIAEQRTEVFAGLETFSQTIDGVLGLDFGVNRDFEKILRFFWLLCYPVCQPARIRGICGSSNASKIGCPALYTVLRCR